MIRVVTFPELKPNYGIGYCRIHLNRLVKAGEFPAPIQLSPNRIGWRQSDIEGWLESRPMKPLAVARP
jgi:prophage regulatory protein